MKLNHVALYVNDLEKMKAFYESCIVDPENNQIEIVE